MTKTIKILFQTIASSAGLTQATKATQEFRGKLAKVAQGFMVLGERAGGAFGQVSKSLGMLLTGGVWGAIAGVGTLAIGKIIDKWKEHNQLMKDARLAARGLSAEWLTAEYRHKQYLKRIDEMKQKSREYADQEKRAILDRQKAAEKSIAQRKEANSFEDSYYALERMINAEKIKGEGLQFDMADEQSALETRVKLMKAAAQAEVDAAKNKVRQLNTIEADGRKLGNSYERELAAKGLELALEKQKNVTKEAERLVEAYRRAKEEARDREDREAAEVEERIRRENEIADRRDELQAKAAKEREASAKKVKAIEEQIAAAKQAAAQWEANAANARGKKFGDWDRGRRDADRERRTADRKQANREAAVDQEIARIEAQSPKARSKWAKDRLAKLREWKEAQNPANNRAAAAVEALQKEAADVAKKSEAHLKDIAEQLKNLGL